MSHDVKKNKFLKKILGALGFKIFPKETIKTERFIESSSINSGDLVKLLINKKKINNIIQIGANDGKSDDFLRTSINADTNVLLVEPIKSAFEELEKNYSNFKNVKFINKAIDINKGKKNIFSVNPKYYNFYQKKYQEKDVSWLTVLASFDKKHLEYHGIKSSHIQSTEIDCINFKELIEQYDYQKLDLLLVDTEGYDDVLVTDFIQNTNIRPVIILEWIHIQKSKAEDLIKLLKLNNYKFYKINKDLICIQNNYF
tara:strand:- start:364 stop:1131 length:768 start_codon:yes stop_codon:yes gene_type:complete